MTLQRLETEALLPRFCGGPSLPWGLEGFLLVHLGCESIHIVQLLHVQYIFDIYIYAYMYRYLSVYAFLHYWFVYISISVQVCIYEYAYIYIYIYIYIYVYTCTL